MIRKEELFTAAAVCASMAGAGFASGREVESFFARFGPGSWLGVAAACLTAGLLTGLLVKLTRQCGAASFPALFESLADSRCRDAVRLLYGLMTLMTAAAMVAASGEMAALALDMPAARLVGKIAAVLAASAFALSGVKPMGAVGLALSAFMGAVCALLGSGKSGSAAFSPGGLMLSLPMGLLYAAFNMTLSAGLIAAASGEAVRPAQTGVLTALLLALTLIPANRALLNAEERVRQAALPLVVMAGQWGCTGYYIMIALMTLAVVTTLSSMLVSLRGQLIELRLPPAAALTAAALAASLLSSCGFELLVGTAYPLLGWACCLALGALTFCLPGRA